MKLKYLALLPLVTAHVISGETVQALETKNNKEVDVFKTDKRFHAFNFTEDEPVQSPGRRNLEARIHKSCRSHHGGGNERRDIIKAYDWLRAHWYQLANGRSYKAIAKTKTHAKTVRYLIRRYIASTKNLYVDCYHTKSCTRHPDVGGKYFGAGRTRICYENMVKSNTNFCDLVGLAAHELGHAALIPVTGDGLWHNKDAPTNDRVYKFGRYARRLCEDEMTGNKNFLLGAGPRVDMTAPEEGKAASLVSYAHVGGNKFRASIRSSARVSGQTSFEWRVRDYTGASSFASARASVTNNYYGTCGCKNKAHSRIAAWDDDGRVAEDSRDFYWVVGCDPDGATRCDPSKCPAGCGNFS